MTLLPGQRTLAADAASTAELQEVIVTAQRTEENLQRVPITVSTVSGDDLLERGAVAIQGLSATIPNLMSTGAAQSTTFIRGVGSFSTNFNNEPAVATYVDGVYVAASNGLYGLFNNIDRIEVLKGPQGTLFGRNTTGGVMQIITSRPKHDFSGNASVGYGNYAVFQGSAYMTGGITENLAADVAVVYKNQANGWGRNLTTGKDIYRGVNAGIRSKWLYTPSDATEVSLALDYGKYRWNMGLQMLPGSFASDRVTTYPGRRFDAYGEDYAVLDNQQGAGLKIDHDFSTLHFTSLTSFRRLYGYQDNDNDRTPLRLNYLETDVNARYTTEELQLSNRDPGRVKWLVGAFIYDNSVAAAEPRIQTGTSVTPNQYQEIYGRQWTRSYAGYGQTTIKVVEGTNLTLGLRYTDEKLRFAGKYLNAAGQLIRNSPFASTTSYNPYTWRVALDHQFTPDVLGFVSYNHGFKAGGYNSTSPEGAPFLPETLDAYELGVKSEFAGRVRLNVSAFYYDYKDIQIAIVPGGAGQIFTNAGAARNYGLDANLEYAASSNLTLSAGFGYLDAKYAQYLFAQGFTATGAVINIPDAKGRDLPYAPKLSGYVSADYRVPMANGALKISANVSYKDRYYNSPAMIPIISSKTLIAATAEWSSGAAKPLSIGLYARNLSDVYNPGGVTASNGGYYSTYAEPRTFGVTLRKEF